MPAHLNPQLIAANGDAIWRVDFLRNEAPTAALVDPSPVTIPVSDPLLDHARWMGEPPERYKRVLGFTLQMPLRCAASCAYLEKH